MIVDLGEFKLHDKKRILLTQDWHIGHKKTRTDIIRSEMENADYVLIGGDWGNFIGPGDFKRYTTIQNKYDLDEYIDATINEAAELCKGLEQKIIGVGCGNHEYECRKRHGVDPTQRLIAVLKMNGAKTVHALDFQGYIQFRMKFSGNEKNCGIDLWYCHGHGGAAERTRGKLDWDIYYSRHHADVYWLGHKHQKDYDEVKYDCVSRNVVVPKLKLGVRTGTYKTEGDVDWSVVKFKTSEAIGGAYLNITSERIVSKDEDRKVFIPSIQFCDSNKVLYERS